MKKGYEYLKVFLYIIFFIVLIISSYLIIVNIKQYETISTKVMVSEEDISLYKNNVNKIEEYVNKTSDTTLKSAVNILKSDGLYKIMPNTKLSYRDIYELNNYFLNSITNDGWITSFRRINKDKGNDTSVTLLVSRANYLNKKLSDNGFLVQETSNNRINDDYEVLINNYYYMSTIILSVMEG